MSERPAASESVYDLRACFDDNDEMIPAPCDLGLRRGGSDSGERALSDRFPSVLEASGRS